MVYVKLDSQRFELARGPKQIIGKLNWSDLTVEP